jgi:hypothetical protein
MLLGNSRLRTPNTVAAGAAISATMGGRLSVPILTATLLRIDYMGDDAAIISLSVEYW